MRLLRLTTAGSVLMIVIIGACTRASAPTIAPFGPSTSSSTTTGAATNTTQLASTTQPLTTEPELVTTVAVAELPQGTDTLIVGEVWAFTFNTGCGYPKYFNDTWWMPTTLTFTHPDYPPDWTVDILNQGPMDGPTARIHNTTISLVDEDRIEIRTDDGQLVAIYEPTDPPGLCG